MKCLRCNSIEMELHTRGEGTEVYEVDICSGCGGLWLDAKELNQLDDNFFVDVEEIELTDVEPTNEDAALNCPRCDGAPLLRKVRPKRYGDVVLDTCRTCKGFWLDSGEFKKVKDVSDRALVASLFDD